MVRASSIQQISAELSVCLAIDDAALAQKPENIIQYRDETIELVQQSLSAGSKPQTRIHLNPAIQSFWDIGAEIRSNGTIGKSTRSIVGVSD